MKKLLLLISTFLFTTVTFSQIENNTKNFELEKYAKGRLIIYLPNGKNGLVNLKSLLNKKIQNNFELDNLGSEKSYVLKFDTLLTKSLLDYLILNKINTYYDIYLKRNTEGVIIPNDPETNFFASDESLALSADLDSFYAYIPPTMSNNIDNSNENCKIVLNEIADPYYIGNELPLIDSINSLNLVTNTSNYSTANIHGTQVAGNCISKQNNGNFSYGVSNVGRYISWNINDGIGPLSSLLITEINKATSYVQNNVSKSIILNLSHTTPGYSLPFSDAINNANNTQSIIIVHSAGNSASNTGDWADLQNFNCWISVGAATPDPTTPAIAGFSNWGSWVDVYMQGTNMRSLELGGAPMGDWQGTSASAPVVTGMINLFWNTLGGRNVISPLQIKTLLKLNKRIMIPQPDGTLKPWVHIWDILCNKLWTVNTTYPTAINNVTTPSINLNTLVNDYFNTMTTKVFSIFKSGTWQNIPSGILNTTTLLNGTYPIRYHWTNNLTIGADGTKTFSEIIRKIVITNTVTPIKLISFTSTSNNCSGVLLNWKTTNEINNKGYEIEQSINGIDFYKIGFVVGVGNSANTNSYNYKVTNLQNSINYFRFKQVDLDGHFEYSPIIKVSNNCNEKNVTVFPNPTKDRLQILGLTSNINNFKIINSLGSTVLFFYNSTKKDLDLSSLPNGIYILTINEKNYKIIKE